MKYVETLFTYLRYFSFRSIIWTLEKHKKKIEQYVGQTNYYFPLFSIPQYITYLQGRPNPNLDKIRDVFTRSCTVHHPKKINMHIEWAAFEETQGIIIIDF